MEERIEELKAMFPEISGIKCAGKNINLGDVCEGGKIDGLPAADYYGEFRGGRPWISPKLESVAKSMGLRLEWQDPGTLFAYPE